MTTESYSELTLKEKVGMLRERGVDAYGSREPSIIAPDVTFPLSPTIYLRGDDDEGPRAVRVLQEHGVHIWQLERHYYYGRYDDDALLEDYWEIVL